MLNVIIRLRALTRDDRGQDLIEYALLGGIIALGSVALLQSAGVEVSNIWTSIVGELQNAQN